MGRWYCAFRCVGDAAEILEHIACAVRQYDLGKYVAVARPEKGARHGEFYLYLGIRDAPEGRIPDEVGRTLLQLPYFSCRINGVLTERQIRASTGSAVALDTYGRSLHYVNPPAIEGEDPFSSPADEEVCSTASERHATDFERLMYWLGAVGAGSRIMFRTACGELGLASNGAQAHNILRGLVLLGHVEPSSDRSRWSAAPPVIVQQDFTTPDASDSFFLSGARDVRLLRTLVELIGDGNLTMQPQNAGPPVVGFRADPQIIHHIISSLASGDMSGLQYGGNSAQLLADALPTIEGWMQALPEVPGFHPYLHQLKRFDGYAFVDDDFTQATGFYEVWPMGDAHGHSTGPKYSLLYDSSRRRWIWGDWYGLRYLAMWLDGSRPRPWFDEAMGQLAIPASSRWPEIYERSLVLASGRLPRRQEHWLIYDCISHDLVRQLQSKLQFSLEREEGLDA